MRNAGNFDRGFGDFKRLFALPLEPQLVGRFGFGDGAPFGHSQPPAVSFEPDTAGYDRLFVGADN